jgi:hypothetical protein
MGGTCVPRISQDGHMMMELKEEEVKHNEK